MAMRRSWICGAVIALAACGGDPEQPSQAPAVPRAQSAANGAPQIVSIRLQPELVTPGVDLDLRYEAVDPDEDDLTAEIEWFVNGQLLRKGPRTRLSTDDLRPLDQVYAILHVSDGTGEALLQTPAIVIANSRPRVTALVLEPSRVRGLDPIVARATIEDAEHDDVELSFEWRVDDRVLEEKGPALPAKSVRRGETLRVRAAARDGSGQGEWFEAAPVVVANSEPLILSEPPKGLAGELRYEYPLRAMDLDGDTPLRFELIDGPPGMEVDLISGLVRWRLPADASGTFGVEVAVRDPHGGVAHQRYDIVLKLEEQKPASPASEDDAE